MADRVILGEQLPADQPFPPASQTSTPMPAHTPGPLSVGVYSPSIAFHRIQEHVAVMRADMTVVALCGMGDDETSQADATLYAAAPQLLDSLLAVEWAGSTVIDEEFGDCVDACPNCFAPIGDAEIEGSGLHFTGCELRDSLDAALGVTLQRAEAAHG